MQNSVIYIDASTGEVGKMKVEGDDITLLENSAVVSLGNSTSDFLITGGYAFVTDKGDEEGKDAGQVIETYPGTNTVIEARVMNETWSLSHANHRMIQNRYLHKGITYSKDGKDRVFMLGGKCYDYYLHSMEELVEGSWIYRSSMATPRASFDAIVNDDKIFVVGGYSGPCTFAEP